MHVEGIVQHTAVGSFDGVEGTLRRPRRLSWRRAALGMLGRCSGRSARPWPTRTASLRCEPPSPGCMRR